MIKRLSDLLSAKQAGSITNEEYTRNYQEIAAAAAQGDKECIDGILEYSESEMQKSLDSNNTDHYMYHLRKAFETASSGARNDSSYAEQAIEYAAELGDTYFQKNEYDKATASYRDVSRLIESYRQLYPDWKYLEKDYQKALYYRYALSALYHAESVADAWKKNQSNEDWSELNDRLKESISAFEKMPERSTNDTYFYATAQKMYLEHCDSSTQRQNGYFSTLSDLEKNIQSLDPSLKSDLYIKLGEAYEQGLGVKRNEKKAVSYIKKAGEAGNTDAKAFYDNLKEEKRQEGLSKGEYAMRSKGSFLTELIIYGVLLIAGFVLFAVTTGISSFSDAAAAFLVGLVFAGIPAGWRTLTKITPQMFVFMKIGAWIVYFLVKGILSMFIGWACLPFRLFKCIKAIRG